MNRRQFLSSGATAAAMTLAGCSTEPRPRLRIGSSVARSFEPLFFARHLAALDENLVQVAEYPTASELMLSFQNQALDAITVTIDDVVRLASYGHDVRIVAILAYSRGFDALIGNADIADVPSLRGKTIAFEADTLGAYLLARALDRHGLAASEVTLKASRADRLNRYITMNLAEAVVTYEPYRSQLLRAGGKVLFDSSEIPGEIVSVLAARGPAIDRQVSSLRHVVSAWNAGVAYLRENQRSAAELVADRERIPADQFLASLQLVRFVDAQESQAALARTDEKFPQLLRQTASFMATHSLVTKHVDVSLLRDDRVVRSA